MTGRGTTERAMTDRATDRATQQPTRRAGRARRLLPLCVGLALSGCIAGAAPGPERGGPGPGRGSVEMLGPAEYAWTLRTLEGNTTRLERYRGRVLFINVWATWCAPCVAEMAGIERLRASLAGSGVEFLLVSPETAEPVERFLRRYRYDLPILLEGEEMPDGFGLRALPTTFIVDRSGRVALRHRGAADWDQPPVRALLLRLAEETP